MRFESVSQFMKAFQELTPRFMPSGSSWAGDETFASIQNKVTNGDSSNLAKMYALIEKIDANVHVEHRTWEASVIGAYPCVPDYLSGNPLNMRRMLPVVTDNSPITVHFDSTVSAGVPANDLLKRGLAIIALVTKLKEIRPVDLVLHNSTRDKNNKPVMLSIVLDTNPISYAHLLPVLSNPAFVRLLMFEYMIQKMNLPSIPFGDIKKTLVLQSSDIVIPALYGVWTEEPVKWINKQLAKYQTD